MLAYNNLTGTLSSSVDRLVNMTYAARAVSALTGIPMSVIVCVPFRCRRTLFVSSNQLTGTLPSSLYNLGNLV